jgi:hypothetical protein
MPNNILRSLISEMIGDYLNESHEDDLIESIFEEVSEETWEAIEEAILNELSPELMARYRNKAVDRKHIAAVNDDDRDYENKKTGISRSYSAVDKQKNDYDNLSSDEFKKKYRKSKADWYNNYQMSRKRAG